MSNKELRQRIFEMEEDEKQLLLKLIEKYGAPVLVFAIKQILSNMVDLDWCFDRGRWQRQLNNLNREAKLRHNLSRVAKELAIANKRINSMNRNIEGQVRAYKNDLKLFRNDRYERKRQAEELIRQAERAAQYAAERERQREKAERQKAIKAEKRDKSIANLMEVHKQYISGTWKPPDRAE